MLCIISQTIPQKETFQLSTVERTGTLRRRQQEGRVYPSPVLLCKSTPSPGSFGCCKMPAERPNAIYIKLKERMSENGAHLFSYQKLAVLGCTTLSVSKKPLELICTAIAERKARGLLSALCVLMKSLYKVSTVCTESSAGEWRFSRIS